MHRQPVAVFIDYKPGEQIGFAEHDAIIVVVAEFGTISDGGFYPTFKKITVDFFVFQSKDAYYYF